MAWHLFFPPKISGSLHYCCPMHLGSGGHGVLCLGWFASCDMKYWNASNLDFIPDIQVNGAGFSADSGLAVYADVAKAHQVIRLHMNLWTWCVGGTFASRLECLSTWRFQPIEIASWLIKTFANRTGSSRSLTSSGVFGVNAPNSETESLKAWQGSHTFPCDFILDEWRDEAFKKSLPDFNFF